MPYIGGTPENKHQQRHPVINTHKDNTHQNKHHPLKLTFILTNHWKNDIHNTRCHYSPKKNTLVKEKPVLITLHGIAWLICPLNILPPVVFIRNKSEIVFCPFYKKIDQVSSMFEAKFHLCPYLLWERILKVSKLVE